MVVGGVIAGSIINSNYSTSSTPSTGQLTIYQLQTGDCLQGSVVSDGSLAALPTLSGHGQMRRAGLQAVQLAVGGLWLRMVFPPGLVIWLVPSGWTVSFHPSSCRTTWWCHQQ